MVRWFTKNKDVWKFYRGTVNGNRRTQKVLFHHDYNQGVTMKAPQSGLLGLLADEMPVAHVTYESSKKGSITIRKLNCTEDELKAACKASGKGALVRDVRKRGGKAVRDRALFDEGKRIILSSRIEKDHNISCQHVDMGSRLNEDLIRGIRYDVAEFCNCKPAKERLRGMDKHFFIVDNVQREPCISVVKANKNERVVAGKGFFDGGCLLDVGVDFSRGCATNMTPDGLWDPSAKCGYCYEFRNSVCYVDTVFDDRVSISHLVKMKMEELGQGDKGVWYIRLGQRTDANVPETIRRLAGFKDNLRITLEDLATLANQREIRVAMPTKFPVFDSELAELYKAANVSVLISVGYSELEKGVVAHGYDLQQRLGEGLKLAEAGVNVGLYPIVDITRSIGEMHRDARAAFEFYNRHSDILKIQFLDARITGKKCAREIGGSDWDNLKYIDGKPGQISFLSKDDLMGNRRFYLTGQTYLAAIRTHGDWLELIGNNKGNVRMCSTHVKDKKERKCGKCFMD
jgi:hypothetical protein